MKGEVVSHTLHIRIYSVSFWLCFPLPPVNFEFTQWSLHFVSLIYPHSFREGLTINPEYQNLKNCLLTSVLPFHWLMWATIHSLACPFILSVYCLYRMNQNTPNWIQMITLKVLLADCSWPFSVPCNITAGVFRELHGLNCLIIDTWKDISWVNWSNHVVC